MSDARTQHGYGMAVQQAPEPRASIQLHIEHIVLEDACFTSAQIEQLQSSLEHELMGLLRTGSLPLQGKAEAVLRAPILESGSTARSPAQLGQSIARSVYAVLRPSTPSVSSGRGSR